MSQPYGKIILVNGASSAGKSTFCKVLQSKLDEPFWHFSIDHLIRDAGILPMERIRSGEFAWRDIRPRFFDGFHRCLPALASAGNNLIVEYIFETHAGFNELSALLAPFDLFLVGIHCPLDELVRRESERGDRKIGDAARDFAVTHTFADYDFEIDSTEPLIENVEKVIAAYKQRRIKG